MTELSLTFKHCAISTLADGRVLISGGIITPRGNGKYNNTLKPWIAQNGLSVLETTADTAEIYNPKTNKYILIYGMKNKRYGHLSLLLPNGQVIIIGGTGSA